MHKESLRFSLVSDVIGKDAEKIRFPSLSFVAKFSQLCEFTMAWTTVTSLYIEDGTLFKLKTINGWGFV